MPQGVGYPAGGMDLAMAARAAEGVPQEGAIPGGTSVNDLLAMLQSGQMDPAMLMQLLAVLSGMGPGFGAGAPAAAPQAGASPIEAAMMGG